MCRDRELPASDVRGYLSAGTKQGNYLGTLCQHRPESVHSTYSQTEFSGGRIDISQWCVFQLYSEYRHNGMLVGEQ